MSTSVAVLGVAVPFTWSVGDVWSEGGVDRLRTPVCRLIGVPPVGIKDYGGTMLLAVFVLVFEGLVAPEFIVPVVIVPELVPVAAPDVVTPF